MKKLLALCLACALLLCGCSGGTAPAELKAPETYIIDTPPADAREEEERTFGLSYLPAYGLNPYTCTATANRALFSLLYESLFVVSGQYRAEPVLCDSFKVSDDGSTYTFTLIDGVRFTDGSPLTAADVEASIKAAKNSALYRGRLSHVSYYVAEGTDTVIVQLDTPYENFALMLDIPILKADSLESTTPLGTGPYVLKGSALERNSYWWQTELPAIDAESIVLQACADQDELRDSFEFGQTDLVYADPNSAAASGYRCDYEVWEAPTTILHFLGFNLYSGYFANDSLRQAVTYIIDREDISNRIYGGFAVASELPCAPSSDLFDRQLAESYDYAPASFMQGLEASAVLSSEDYVNHVGYFVVCADDPTRIEAAEYLCEVLKGYGLNLQVNVLDKDSYKEALNKGNFDLYYGEVRLTNDFALGEFFEEDGSLDFGEISNAGLNALCQAALENSGSYVELCAQLIQQAPICPVVFKSYAVYATRGIITDLNPAVDFVFHNDDLARTLADADKSYEAITENS